MFGKKIIVSKPSNTIKYKFNINDTVLCIVKNEIKDAIIDAIILSRCVIKDENYYKIGNSTSTKTVKESVLIHR